MKKTFIILISSLLLIATLAIAYAPSPPPCLTIGCTYTASQWASFLSGQLLTASSFNSSSSDGTHYIQAYNTSSVPTCSAGTFGSLTVSGNPPILYICGNSGWSAVGNGSGVNLPIAPTVTASAGNGSITCSWAAISNATSYTGFYGTSSPPSTQSNNVTSAWIISGLTNTVPEYCAVEACNTAGCSASSNIATATPTSVLSAPGVPMTVAAVAGNMQNTVTWSAPTSGGTASSYNLFWSNTDMGSNCLAGTNVVGVTSPDVITSLTNGQTYYYMLKAINSAGASNCSAEVSATPCTPQTITLSVQPTLALTVGTNGTTGTFSSSSGLTVSTVSSNTNAFTISGTATVPQAAGTGYITYSQAGNATYCAANNITSNTITVSNPSPTQQGGYSGTLTASAIGTTPATATDYIMQNYSLTASTITEAKIENYYAAFGGGTTAWIAFKVWRLSGGTYTLIGNTGHISMQTTAGVQTYTFSGITCQTGDILGYATNAGGPDTPYGAVDVPNGSATYYYKAGDITSGTVTQASMTSQSVYSNVQIQFFGN